MTLDGCPEKVSINPGELLGLILRAQYQIRRSTPIGTVPPEGIRMAMNDLHRAANLLNMIQESDRCPS